MKKISLKNLNLKEVEQLSREQLKNVLGGWADGTRTTYWDITVNCPDDMPHICNCPTFIGCVEIESDCDKLCSGGA